MKPIKKRQPSKHVELTDNFRSVVVNGLTLTLDKNGQIVISGQDDIVVNTSGTITTSSERPIRRDEHGNIQFPSSPSAVTNDTAPPSLPLCDIGTELPDGWIVAGISPDTNEAFSFNPDFCEDDISWDSANTYAHDLKESGRESTRLPSKSELKVIFGNIVWKKRNAHARFHTQNKHNRFWSSNERKMNDKLSGAWLVSFRDGSVNWMPQNMRVGRALCVRDEPQFTPERP